MKKTYLVGLSLAVALTACSSNHEEKTAVDAAQEADATVTEAASEVATAEVPEAPVVEEAAVEEVAVAEEAPAVEEPAAVAVAATKSGEELYQGFCQTCHAAGIAGAPKLDDKANWAPRIAQGKDTLYQHALEGYTGSSGVMPPKGGSSYTDDEVKAVVDYMVEQAS